VTFFRDRRRVLLASSLAIALLGAVIVFVRSGDDGTTSLTSSATTTSTTNDDAEASDETTTTSTSTTLAPTATVTTAKAVGPTTTTTTKAQPKRGFGSDGWIIYDISGEEHLVAPDGSGDYLFDTAITEPAWSRDHSTLVFAPHAQRPGRGMHYARSDGVLHAFGNSEGYSWPTFSADGMHVYASAIDHQYGQDAFVATIRSLALDGSDDHVILQPQKEVNQLAASPDGSTIAFIYGGQVALMNPDGSNLRNAPNSPQGAFWLDWTNDSQSVLFAYQGDIWKLNVHDGTRTQVTNTPNSTEGNPQVSPDGTMFACSVDGGRGIDVMKLDGSQRHHIVDAPVYEIAW
jgi:hypothetical protein